MGRIVRRESLWSSSPAAGGYLTVDFIKLSACGGENPW